MPFLVFLNNVSQEEILTAKERRKCVYQTRLVINKRAHRHSSLGKTHEERARNVTALSFFGAIHATPEKFVNGGFTLKTHQMFSVHSSPEEFKNAAIAGHFGFVFELSSVWEIT